MASINAEIKTIADENAAIIARIEAKKEVQRRVHSLETGQKDGRMWFKVSESVESEDGEAYRKQWKFTGQFRQDFPRCIGGDLNWDASSWNEIKKLNGDIKDVAASLIDTFLCQDTEWEQVSEKCETWLHVYLDNLKSIKIALVGVEASVNGESRRDELQQDFDAIALRASGIMAKGDFRPSAMAFKGSSILRDLMKEQQQLLSWYPGEWKLIYKGSEHGMSAANFHECADGKGPTITLVQSGENICGGYTQVPWKGGPGAMVHDAAASLFVLKNGSKDEPALCPVLNNGQNAVCHNANWGPTFGTGHDLACFPANGQPLTKNFGRNYQNTTGRGEFALTGGQQQNNPPNQVEVFERIKTG